MRLEIAAGKPRRAALACGGYLRVCRGSSGGMTAGTSRGLGIVWSVIGSEINAHQTCRSMENSRRRSVQGVWMGRPLAQPLVIRRISAAAITATLLAGCGASGSRADQHLLSGTGIGTITFGRGPKTVAAGLERLLGRPSSASAASTIGYFRSIGCGLDHEIIWAGLAVRAGGSNSAGLTLYFKHSRFVGYAYGPPYGRPRGPVVRHGLMLSTTNGLGLDETLARGRMLYGRAFVVTTQPQGTPPNPRLERLPAWEARATGGRIYGFIDSPSGTVSSSHLSIGSISAGAIPNTPCR
jgi:hypothetical protein